jgi:hypothetical protein
LSLGEGKNVFGLLFEQLKIMLLGPALSRFAVGLLGEARARADFLSAPAPLVLQLSCVHRLLTRGHALPRKNLSLTEILKNSKNLLFCLLRPLVEETYFENWF